MRAILEANASVVLMIVVFWYAAWGLLDELKDFLEEHYGFTELQIYGTLFALVIAFVCFTPKFLIRL